MIPSSITPANFTTQSGFTRSERERESFFDDVGKVTHNEENYLLSTNNSSTIRNFWKGEKETWY